jgi:hypothetical protein
MFEDRVETRYLEHIRVLLPRATSGFAVLALDCALIETLEQFRQGKGTTPDKHGKRYFVAFLTQTAFKGHFDEALAKLFYKTIRCGLLHQAEAGGNSRVKRGTDLAVASYTSDKKGIVVNKDKFHTILETVIHEYVEILRAGTDIKLREAFIKKMNYICRVEAKASALVGVT